MIERAASRRIFLLACSLVALLSSIWVGDHGPRYYSDHRGLFLVSVNDREPAPAPRPRRTFVVVFDGLGFEEATTMSSLAALRGEGRCFKTDVGPLPVSRPVYAVLSTGLEQDRTGVRSNLLADPLEAVSIWQLARTAGLRTSAISDLTWWQQLFPGGFTDYKTEADEHDYFKDVSRADLTLIHPVYIDEVGHRSGAASAEYKQAVLRADGELKNFLSTIDLTQDLLVVTADHGHALQGGHGGLEDRVAHVLTCYAGWGIRPSPELGSLKTSSIAPSLSMLLNLKFPPQMRAGDDELDKLSAFIDLPPAKMLERQAGLEQFRRENEIQVGRWMKSATPQGWNAFYTHQHHRQLLAWAAVILLSILISSAGLVLLNNFTPRKILQILLACALCMGATAALHIFFHHGFDWTSTNGPFVRSTLSIALGTGLLFLLILYFLERRLPALDAPLSALLLCTAVLAAGHLCVFGILFRCPMPGPALVLFPYFASICLGLWAFLGIGLWLVLGLQNHLTKPAS